MLAYIIPTHDRPGRLAQTLTALGDLPRHCAQVIVVDNASRPILHAPRALANGLDVRIVRRPRNEGAAARTAGARAADPSCEWLVMLDDDSYPTDLGVIHAIADASADVAAIGAEITLPHAAPHPRHEAGGLPEVFVGCGVALRRCAYLEAGGYDPAFDYYAEEYDLAARLLLAGHRVTLDRRFRVEHHKVEQGRDMGRILRRLVRNNGWVMERYAPADLRRAEIGEVVSRYRAIATRERARLGYAVGLAEFRATSWMQRRTPMSRDLFDRFTGLAAAREALHEAHWRRAFDTAAIIDEGKNARQVRAAVREIGVRLIDNPEDAQVLVIGTLSPGPLLDAFERAAAAHPHRRIIAPWPNLLGTAHTAERAGVAVAA